MVRTITRRSGSKSAYTQPESPPRVHQTKRGAVRPTGASEQIDSSNINDSCETRNGPTVKDTDATENAHFESQMKENITENFVKGTSTVEDASEGEREGKGKSKSKNKTDLENSSLLNENEQQTNSHISETVQVTAQSPSIDNPVDNENGNSVVSDASNCVHSVINNVDKLNEEDATPSETIDDSKRTDRSQSRDVVESEQSSEDSLKQSCNENNVNATTYSSTNSEHNETKTNRSISVDSSIGKESKKVRLRRNTVQGVETPKVLQKSTTSQENERNENETSESDKLEQKIKKAGVRIKLNRDRCRVSISKEKDSNEDSIEGKREGTINDGGEITENIPSKHMKWNGVYQWKTIMSKIDMDALKEMCTKIKVLQEKDVKLDLPKERVKTSSESEKKIERKISLEFNSEDSDRPEFKKQISSNSSSDEAKEDKNIIAFNRKISIVHDTASKLKPPPEPAKNPVSEILFITNLVRPFTVKQLRELLERTGKIVEGGFWTDRIKSKCYVHYETKEEAEDTRNALHGVNWPIGNGKKLMIEYATIDEMEKCQNPPSTTPPRSQLPKEKLLNEKENKDPVKQRKHSEDAAPKDTTKDSAKRRDVRVREWDIGKEDLNRKRSVSRSRDRERDRRSRSRERVRSRDQERSRERQHSRDKDRSHKYKRTPSPVGGYVPKKLKKPDEEVPQKLMDDLFLKTKATPSIYWQPLTPEEIATKQQQRLMRMEEHKRRMEVSSRSRGGREAGRGVAYRRR